MGADSHLTPREVIRDFIELLDILYQNPSADVSALLRSGDYAVSGAAGGAAGGAGKAADVAPQFAEFTI